MSVWEGKLTPYEERVSVAHRCKHDMTNEANPFCSKCGLRTFPLWERPHDCAARPDVARVRHLAGDILANMHFYRVPAEVQLAAMAEAFAFALGDYVHPGRLQAKLKKVWPTIQHLATEQANRVIANRQLANIVMDVNRKRSIKIKKKHDRDSIGAHPRCKKCANELHGKCSCGWTCACYAGNIDKKLKKKGAKRDMERAKESGRKRITLKKRRS